MSIKKLVKKYIKIIIQNTQISQQQSPTTDAYNEFRYALGRFDNTHAGKNKNKEIKCLIYFYLNYFFFVLILSTKIN